MLVFTALLAFIAGGRVAGRGVAIFTLIALAFIDVIGLWPETMTTLAHDRGPRCCSAPSSAFRSASWQRRSDRIYAVVRPVLDINADHPVLSSYSCCRSSCSSALASCRASSPPLSSPCRHRPADQSRHPQRARGSCRGQPMPSARRHASCCGMSSSRWPDAHHHGRAEPDADAGTVHGGHLPRSSGRRPWPTVFTGLGRLDVRQCDGPGAASAHPRPARHHLSTVITPRPWAYGRAFTIFTVPSGPRSGATSGPAASLPAGSERPAEGRLSCRARVGTMPAPRRAQRKGRKEPSHEEPSLTKFSRRRFRRRSLCNADRGQRQDMPGEGVTVNMAQPTWDIRLFHAETYKQLSRSLGYASKDRPRRETRPSNPGGRRAI